MEKCIQVKNVTRVDLNRSKTYDLGNGSKDKLFKFLEKNMGNYNGVKNKNVISFL